MKTISTIFKTSIVAIAVFASTGASAQVDLKANVLGLAANDYGLSGEYSISENMSVQLGMMYSINKFGASSSLADIDADIKWTGFKVIPSFRFYFSPDDPTEGFFVEPYVRYKSQKRSGMSANIPVDANGDYDENWDNNTNAIKYENRSYTNSRTKIGFGLAIGKKWVHDSGFVFETFAGFGKNADYEVKYSDTDVQDYYKDILTFDSPIQVHGRLGLSVGFRF